MRCTLQLLLLTAFFMASCTNEVEEFYQESHDVSASNLSLTRSCFNDSTVLGELVCLEESDELLRLKNDYKKIHTHDLRAQVLSSTNDFFSSNIYAIREMPVTISARAVASSGSTSANKYFYCDGTGKEVTLGSSSTVAGSKFYLKVLPATTGIPYLIYSNVSKTPLTVGYYTDNPDNKILMAAKDNSSSLFSSGWDLIPSSYYKGYFSIQSESYLGQSDPDNMWSIFYYVLEAKAANKLGYAQRVNNKAQQEFLITPTNSFTLQDVTFDLANATVTSSTMLSKVTSLTNKNDYVKNEKITVTANANETSVFYEAAGTLKLNISSLPQVKFPRPIPVAGQAVIYDDSDKDASYSSSTQTFPTTVEYLTSIDMKPRSLLQLTTRFKTFILNVPYIAVAKYNDREVKVSGTWRGYAIANPEYNTPINEPRFFDLETGEELNYSLVFDEMRKTFVVK